MQSVIRLKFLQRRMCLLHAACLSVHGKGILLVAPPETGKTYSCLILAKEHDFHILSDDTILVNEQGEAFCYPLNLTIHPLHLKYLSLNYKTSLSIKLRDMMARLPWIGGIIGSYKLAPQHALGNKIIRKIRVTKVFFLEKGKGYAKELKESDALKKILASGRMHQEWYENRFILLYNYKVNALDMEELIMRQRKICEKFPIEKCRKN